VENVFLQDFRAVRGLPQAHDWSFRYDYAHRYAWSIPTPNALKAIKNFSPQGIVEIGAGTGYWAALLRARGTDIIAYDAAPPVRRGRNRYHPDGHTWTTVLRGYASAAAEHPERALMLCWPPWKQPVSHRALNAYAGDRLIYIGQGWRGYGNTMTGTEQFHNTLAADWQLVYKLRLLNWPEISDGLYLYRRLAKS
jgi:hypothetical protein